MLKRKTLYFFTFTAASMSFLVDILVPFHGFMAGPVMHVHKKSLELNLMGLSVQKVAPCITCIIVHKSLEKKKS